MNMIICGNEFLCRHLCCFISKTLFNVFMYDVMTSNGCLSWALGYVVWNVNLRGMTSHMAYEMLTFNVMWPVGAHSQIKSWWIDVLRPWAYALGYLNGWVTRVLRHYLWRHAWRNFNWDIKCDVAVSPCTQVYDGNISGKYSGSINRYEI